MGNNENLQNSKTKEQEVYVKHKEKLFAFLDNMIALDKQIAEERSKVLTTEQLMQQCKDTEEWAKSIGAEVVDAEDIIKRNKRKNKKK